jgi:hypothetical protein
VQEKYFLLDAKWLGVLMGCSLGSNIFIRILVAMENILFQINELIAAQYDCWCWLEVLSCFGSSGNNLFCHLLACFW